MIRIPYQSVFISYAHTEGDFVNQLEADLQHHQVHTWIDYSNIQDGSNWLDTIEQAIQKCDVLLIILSQQAIASEYVKMEYRYARYLNKRIIPLYYTSCSLIPIDLYPLQWIDFSKSYEDGFNHLLATLECKKHVSTKSSIVEKIPQYTQSFQETVTTLLRRGQLAYLTEHYEDAIQFYTQALSLNPDQANIYHYRGAAHFCLNQYEQAIIDYNKALHIDPHDAATYYKKGVVLSLLKKDEEAIQSYTQSITLDPDLVASYYNRGLAHIRLKHHKQALIDFEKALRLDPHDALIYVSKGEVLQTLHHDNEALAVFDYALRFDPHLVTPHIHKGLIFSASERYREALIAFDHALHLDPNNVTLYLYKGDILNKLKQHKEALSHFERAIRLYPYKNFSQEDKSAKFMYLTHYSGAFTSTKRTSHHFFEETFPLQERDFDLTDLKIYDEVSDHDLHSHPYLAHAYLGKGYALHGLQRENEATMHLRKALLLDARLAQACYLWETPLPRVQGEENTNKWQNIDENMSIIPLPFEEKPKDKGKLQQYIHGSLKTTANKFRKILVIAYMITIMKKDIFHGERQLKLISAFYKKVLLDIKKSKKLQNTISKIFITLVLFTIFLNGIIINPKHIHTISAGNIYPSNNTYDTYQAQYQAQIKITKTLMMKNPYPSYIPENGRLTFYDLLKSDNNGYQWLPTTPPSLPRSNGNCAFKGDGLEASVDGDANYVVLLHPCITNNTNFSDFAYEVHMKLFTGDCGGVTFRGRGDAFYYFIICQDGQYRIVKYMGDPGAGVTPMPRVNPILRKASSQYINMNPHQDNLISVWAKGTEMRVYVNEQMIDSIQDDSYSSGHIGVIAKSWTLNDPTQAVFSNARIWALE